MKMRHSSKHSVAAMAAGLTCLLAFAVQGAGPPRTPADSPVLKDRNETPEQHDARMAWWREAKFGMFIHWSLFSQLGGEWKGKMSGGGYAEWIMYNEKISIADYAAVAKDFNPGKYDAEKWVMAAKNAGMKYMVITAKHHDGFAMFKSAASPFNMVDATPFKRDPLKELADACRKHGMKLGFYYSQNYDWHHPGGALNDWDPASKGDYDKYTDEIVIPQLREILKNYGDIAILWFDMGGGGAGQHERIHKAVMECNPKIITNNRLGGPFQGDTETPEQNIPANGLPGRDWETCMTMNGTWGYRKGDNGWKSTPDLLRNLCKIASKGGNYLLNVGPNELGEIPAGSLEHLAQVGEWMKVNGAVIYGTSASPFPHQLSWGWVTSKGNLLYICVDQLPADHKLTLPELTTRISKACFLADTKKQALAITTADNGIPTIAVPDPSPVSFGGNPAVIVAELTGGPVATILDFVFPGMPDAVISGNNIRVEVPKATDLTKLAPTYRTGSPLVKGTPASGSTNDFTKPLTYSITAADGSTRAYVVTVLPRLGAVSVANHSFEEFDFLNEYDETIGKNPPGATWTFKDGAEAGINHLKGPITAPPSPDGSQHTAHLRGAGSSFSQAINSDQGNYRLSFSAVKRSGYAPTPVPLTVTMDETVILKLESGQLGKEWGTFTTPAFPLTAGSHTLTFTLGKAEGDAMDLIDNVVITYCP
ncbi:MAG: alpha-L-fucosidase [Verrucomicrobia bacterium]|nr:alpha-L-fucosidase [Verrucomicrobiota bacterium]